jgi:hypothetical protein
MNQIVRLSVASLGLAGLVSEAVKTREVEQFHLSFLSCCLICLYALIIFVSALRPFNAINLNIGNFDFDQFCLSANLTPSRDRSCEILKSIGYKSESPPRR